jgi:hypothetical protein
MHRRALIVTGIVGAAALALVSATLWKGLSKKYIIRWNISMLTNRSKAQSGAKRSGNFCIVERDDVGSVPSVCTEAQLFPGVYAAIGVDDRRIIKWQSDHGFDSGGVDSSGSLLAPGYPVISRLAWSNIEPVFLSGDEISMLISEVDRISRGPVDPELETCLGRISAIAATARQEEKLLRIG